MTGTTAPLRITVALLVGFVLIQVGVIVITFIPHQQTTFAPYNLPSPARVAVMVALIEQTPMSERAGIADAFDGSLYRVKLGSASPTDDPFFASRAAPYRTALGGRPLAMTGRHPVFTFIAEHDPWARWVSQPVSIAIPLKGGGSLVIASTPSATLSELLQQRAVLWALAGMIALLALTLAVRATSRPIVRLARNVRTFTGTLDAPNLPMEGPREIKDLATAFNEMKARIVRLVDERTRILGAIAHDMRTYLTRIRLRAEFIADGEQRLLAVSDLDEMAQLLDDTLLFARQRAAKRTPTPPIDLVKEVNSLVGIRLAMGQHLRCGVLPKRAMATIAPLALRRILGNLVDNANRYAGEALIDLEGLENHWKIDVADDGPGIPPSILSRLGEPFARPDPSRDRLIGGAGLGLAIVKALAEEQGGSVSFANRSQGGFVASVVVPAGWIEER